MLDYKQEILNKICYTKLVYERINKKLALALSKNEIEAMISLIILETQGSGFKKIGKNIYVTNNDSTIRLTINYSTKSIITADKIS